MWLSERLSPAESGPPCHRGWLDWAMNLSGNLKHRVWSPLEACLNLRIIH